MASPIDIVNLALSHLGEVPNISSISPPEGSVHAEKAARFYPIARDKCLEAHNWNFAVKRAALAGLSDPPTPWLNAYALPSDYLRAIAVRPAYLEASIANIPDLPYGNRSYSAEIFANANDDELNVVDYTIEGDRLYCNGDGATLRYVAKVADSTKWTPHFVDAVSWLLASYMAGAIVEDEKVIAWAYRMYQAELMNAMVADSNSIRRTNATHRAPWVRDR